MTAGWGEVEYKGLPPRFLPRQSSSQSCHPALTSQKLTRLASPLSHLAPSMSDYYPPVRIKVWKVFNLAFGN